jgi:hypothetical protein
LDIDRHSCELPQLAGCSIHTARAVMYAVEPGCSSPLRLARSRPGAAVTMKALCRAALAPAVPAYPQVRLMRCVDKEGPAWFWRCNSLHIELQRCYEAAKPPTTSLLSHTIRDYKEVSEGRCRGPGCPDARLPVAHRPGGDALCVAGAFIYASIYGLCSTPSTQVLALRREQAGEWYEALLGTLREWTAAAPPEPQGPPPYAAQQQQQAASSADAGGAATKKA